LYWAVEIELVVMAASQDVTGQVVLNKQVNATIVTTGGHLWHKGAGNTRGNI